MSIRNLLARLFGRRAKGGMTGIPEGYEYAGTFFSGRAFLIPPGVRHMTDEMMSPDGIYRGMRLCPKCIYRLDDNLDIIEVIDCRTNNTHNLNEHGWNGPLTGNGDSDKP